MTTQRGWEAAFLVEKWVYTGNLEHNLLGEKVMREEGGAGISACL